MNYELQSRGFQKPSNLAQTPEFSSGLALSSSPTLPDEYQLETTPYCSEPFSCLFKLRLKSFTPLVNIAVDRDPF